jgi:TolB-like protein
VVVLPFANFSDDPEQQYFADGISEDIAIDLANVSALTVIAGRRSLFDRHGSEIGIARQFGATHVLEGSVRKGGERLRITAQLVSGDTGAQVWAERYDREMADIFQLQDEISREVVNALRLQLLPGERIAIESRGTRNPDAYDALLKARALRSTSSLECIRQALGLYRQALDIDPDFARAWAGLASALIQNRSHLLSRDISDADIEHALAMAERIAPDLPDTLASRLQHALLKWEWARVDDAIVRLKRLDLSDWSMLSIGLLVRGRCLEAVEHQRKICASEPFSMGAALILEIILAAARRIDEAEEVFQQWSGMPGSGALAYETFKRAVATGDRERAKAILSAHLDEGIFLSRTRDLAERMDDRDEALAILRTELDESASKDPLGIMQVAHLAMYFDDEDLALEAIRKAIEPRLTHFNLLDIWHPCFAPLYARPEFKAVIEGTGLVEHCRATGEWGEFLRPVGSEDFEVIP